MARAVKNPPTVTLPAQGQRHRLEARATGAAIVRLADETQIGCIAFETTESTTLAIHSIEVDEAARGYGAGSEAIRLLLASAHGFDAVTAAAPSGQGLPVYFWSRMGFRPLFGALEGGGIAFRRDLDGA
jgi:N-acetylglutamate synthase-like GNAT family acetyltransferase